MNQSQISPEKKCQYCEKTLHGRSDQRFCNDHCRNTFNRYKRAAEKIEEHENTPEIFRIIKRNYEILKTKFSTPTGKDEGSIMETAAFLKLGIQPKFCTSAFIDEREDIWKCVFEIGFSMGEKYTLIKYFPEQAAL